MTTIIVDGSTKAVYSDTQATHKDGNGGVINHSKVTKMIPFTNQNGSSQLLFGCGNLSLINKVYELYSVGNYESVRSIKFSEYTGVDGTVVCVLSPFEADQIIRYIEITFTTKKNMFGRKHVDVNYQVNTISDNQYTIYGSGREYFAGAYDVCGSVMQSFKTTSKFDKKTNSVVECFSLLTNKFENGEEYEKANS